MTVNEIIKNRRSIRVFKDKEVPMEDLHKVLDAGLLAPSTRNFQNWKFIAVTDKEVISKMQVACGDQPQVGSAPAVIALCANESFVMPCGQETSSIDCSIALSFMMLQAYELGLGTCWIGGFDDKAVKEVLCIPQDYTVVCLTPLGYADEATEARDRKDFEDVVCFNSFK